MLNVGKTSDPAHDDRKGETVQEGTLMYLKSSYKTEKHDIYSELVRVKGGGDLISGETRVRSDSRWFHHHGTTNENSLD